MHSLKPPKSPDSTSLRCQQTTHSFKDVLLEKNNNLKLDLHN